MSDDVPKWLERRSGTVNGQPSYRAAEPLDDILMDVDRDDCGDCQLDTLDDWLAWRSRVAEALGLVELEMREAQMIAATAAAMMTGEDPAKWIAAVRADRKSERDKAVAAELRRQVDEMLAEGNDGDFGEGIAMFSERLRKRADELDPPSSR